MQSSQSLDGAATSYQDAYQELLELRKRELEGEAVSRDLARRLEAMELQAEDQERDWVELALVAMCVGLALAGSVFLA